MKDLLEKLEAAAEVAGISEEVGGWYPAETLNEFADSFEDAEYIALANPATILQLVASYKATSQALRRAVEALEDIAKYDCPSEGGKYTKVWMTLGKKAKDALASIQQLGLGEGGTE